MKSLEEKRETQRAMLSQTHLCPLALSKHSWYRHLHRSHLFVPLNLCIDSHRDEICSLGQRLTLAVSSIPSAESKQRSKSRLDFTSCLLRPRFILLWEGLQQEVVQQITDLQEKMLQGLVSMSKSSVRSDDISLPVNATAFRLVNAQINGILARDKAVKDAHIREMPKGRSAQRALRWAEGRHALVTAPEAEDVPTGRRHRRFVQQAHADGT